MAISEKVEKSEGPLNSASKTLPLPPQSTSSRPTSLTSPPSYKERQAQDIPDLSLRLCNLKLHHQSTMTADHCIAHLKLLEAFHHLREDVANIEGLFGIDSAPSSLANDTTAQARIREKRWQVYVARAVTRFEIWWRKCIPQMRSGYACRKITCADVSNDKTLREMQGTARPLLMFDTAARLPPLDVLMVWHAYQLNPRCFYEDCLRLGKLDFWATGFPFAPVDKAIDPTSFEYSPSSAAKDGFERETRLQWDNLQDPLTTRFQCNLCHMPYDVPWTQGAGYTSPDGNTFSEGTGFADPLFRAKCPQRGCSGFDTHDMLRVMKFRSDVETLLSQDLPMPGTVLDVDGRAPEIATNGNEPQPLFPSILIKKQLHRDLMQVTDPSQAAYNPPTMNTVKRSIEKAVTNETLIRLVKTTSTQAYQREKIAVRRMMSKYWFNSSPFGLDLVGAVIRQGSFIDKMHNLNWLHSPALNSTMNRLLLKYQRFFSLMGQNPRKLAVPTLDVDLGWHTHQLRPQSYYTHSIKVTGKFVDHDDKIEEAKLSEAFAWTSKVYQKQFGEPYSECTCWYCEAVRESHTSGGSKLFKTSNYKASNSLHKTVGVASDPLNSPHISAHNAVKDRHVDVTARMNAARLDENYHKACTRAKKEGREPPRRDDYFYPYVWGYPMYYPMYVPYGVDPCIAGGNAVYPEDPGYIDTRNGASGSCASGTCAGTASYGGSACAATGGSCGGAGTGGGCSSGGGDGGGGGCGGGCGGGD